MELGPPYSGHLSFIAESKPKEQPLPRNDGMWVEGGGREMGTEDKMPGGPWVKEPCLSSKLTCAHTPSVSTGMKGP